EDRLWFWQSRVDDVADLPVLDAQGVEESVARDVDQRLDVDAARQDVEDLADVDPRWRQQLLAERPPELLDIGVRRVLLEQAPGEREPVAVDAGAPDADDHVVG